MPLPSLQQMWQGSSTEVGIQREKFAFDDMQGVFKNSSMSIVTIRDLLLAMTLLNLI